MSSWIKTLIIIISLLINIVDVQAENPKPGKQNTRQLLRSYLNLNSFRHKVLAQNIANVNTPGYKADEVPMPANMAELAEISSNSRKKIKLIRTSAKHLPGINDANNSYYLEKLKDPYEIKPNGNNISLDQQITKLSQNQTDNSVALKAYQNDNSLYSIVLGD